MCMNCGCGEPEKRHKPTDITTEDIQRAAEGGGISTDEATANLRKSLDQMSGATQPTSGDYSASR
ncbi:MAG TPA: hypothetical protein VD763_05930 [Candidatus Saccharimonadales bacterium]|nr:hypothetical protein [Candidatus Saccharimonadales bacterium]